MSLTIHISLNQDEDGRDIYEIRSPYNEDLIFLIKQVPGRKYVKERRVWTVPKNKLGFLLKELKGTQFEDCVYLKTDDEQIGENAALATTKNIPNIDVSQFQWMIKDGCAPFQHQTEFLQYAVDRFNRGRKSGFILGDDMGLGKALTLDTPIPTPTGMTTMGALKVGDTVFNENGEPVTVLQTFEHELLEMYKVTFVDGTSVTCCKDHLWYIKHHSDSKYSVRNTDWIVHGGKYGPKKYPRSETIKALEIPKCKPVQFDHQDVFLDPWAFGALLGDGSMRSGVSFTSSYPDIIAMMQKTLPVGYVLSGGSDISYNISRADERSYGHVIYQCVETGEIAYGNAEANNKWGIHVEHAVKNPEGYSAKLDLHFRILGTCRNEVRDWIRQLGLADCGSADKFIPDVYKFNDVESRWALLQGLMDTDGYAAKENTHIYTTISKRLAQDIVFIVQSLGGLATIREYPAKLDGRILGSAYDVTIRVDDPRMLYRCYKKERAEKRKFTPLKKLLSVEYAGQLPGKCITVSGDSHLYLCGDFIVTHNTVQSVNLAKYRYDNKVPGRCLIVCCVNSAKYNFVDDIKKHSNGAAHPYLLGSRLCKVGPRKGLPRKGDPSMAEKLEDLVTGKMYGGDFGDKKLPFYLVVNIEAFRYRVKKKYPFTEQVAKMCNSGQISMIIIDEVHKNMGPTSTQGKQMLALKKMLTRPTMFLPMTGTIILNRPTDAFLPLRLVDGHNYNSFYTWQQEFCVFGGFGGKEVIAYKNIPKMKEMLEANMLRRKKEDVLDLPEKIYITEYVENGPYQQKLYDQVATDVITQKLSIVADMNPLARFMRLRQVNSAPEIIDPSINVMDKSYLSKNAKLSRCLELIEDAVEAGGKVLVFSNWVEPLRTLYKYTTQRWKTCCYTGTMSEADREKHKQTFINNPEYKVMLGTVGAMGVSHTFTVAQTLIFYDEPWTAGDKQQCADRVHRIGITGSPNIITLITKDTIDERVHHIVYQKEGISDYIVDNKLDIYSNPELFDLLLSDTVKNS